MKKTLIIAFGLILFLAACNRAAFVKKLTGTWKLSRYLYAGKDESPKIIDTTMNNYRLTMNEDQLYLESWLSLYFHPDSLIHTDTIYTNPADSSIFNLVYDTIRFVATDTTTHANNGRWDLLNSESDLQLRSDSANSVRIFRLLNLSGSSLDIRNGNEEFYLQK